jgi:exosortase/archaeosortase family protein
VEDACSGIRSFQACLMISLFLGAYHRLRVSRRLVLVTAGFLLALVFNLGRTVLLVAVASRQGISAIAEWHDPAGVTILVGCFIGVWLLSVLLARWAGRAAEKASVSAGCREISSPAGRHASALAAGVLLWFVVCEVGVEVWYGRHESRPGNRVAWEVHLPADAAAFHELPFEEQTKQLLRFDEGRNATWTEPNGTRCQAIFLQWNPGRIAVHLARSHTPEVCLTSSGRKLAGGSVAQSVAVGGLTLTFDVYYAEVEGLWVYYCLWEDGFSDNSNQTEQLTYRNRLRPVIEGRRNRGQRSLEIAVWSNADAGEVHSEVTRLVQSVVQVKPAP